MKHSYEFEFKRIILKPLEQEDIESLRILRNRERQYFATQQEIAKEGQEKWYQSYLKKEDDIMFKIVKKENPEEFIGAIALYDINPENKTAEFGRTLVDKTKAPEKGIGTDATKAVCLFGFDIINVEKIVGEALKTNKRILKVYDRAGFAIVGEEKDMYKLEMTRDMLCLD